VGLISLSTRVQSEAASISASSGTDRVPSDAEQPWQRVSGHLVKTSPGDQEDVRHDVVDFASSHSPTHEGAHRSVMGAKEAFKPLPLLRGVIHAVYLPPGCRALQATKLCRGDDRSSSSGSRWSGGAEQLELRLLLRVAFEAHLSHDADHRTRRAIRLVRHCFPKYSAERGHT
jgi:hypothetical protein